jgi:hypothetical protein
LLPAGAATPFGGFGAAALPEPGAAAGSLLPPPPEAQATNPSSSEHETRDTILRDHGCIETPS